MCPAQKILPAQPPHRRITRLSLKARVLQTVAFGEDRVGSHEGAAGILPGCGVEWGMTISPNQGCGRRGSLYRLATGWDASGIGGAVKAGAGNFTPREIGRTQRIRFCSSLRFSVLCGVILSEGSCPSDEQTGSSREPSPPSPNGAGQPSPGPASAALGPSKRNLHPSPSPERARQEGHATSLLSRPFRALWHRIHRPSYPPRAAPGSQAGPGLCCLVPSGLFEAARTSPVSPRVVSPNQKRGAQGSEASYLISYFLRVSRRA